jgi:tRNA dihydrouridine synthase A
MMEWTDRHCRMFHRCLEPAGHALYRDGDRRRGGPRRPRTPHRLRSGGTPARLQLGGSDPDALARAAAYAQDFGYDEVNLNCGCPSDRVQSGRFGACLMAEPELVARCFAAMQDRGIDPGHGQMPHRHRRPGRKPGAGPLRRRTRSRGCRTFIVHARKAWLQGLSPKENRDVPPLNHARVHRLKADRPDLEIIINGGIASLDEAEFHLQRVDGVMLSTASCWAAPPTMTRGSSPTSIAGCSAPPTRSRSRKQALEPPGFLMSKCRARPRRSPQRHDPPRPRPVQRRRLDAGRARLPAPHFGERPSPRRRRRTCWRAPSNIARLRKAPRRSRLKRGFLSAL